MQRINLQKLINSHRELNEQRIIILGYYAIPKQENYESEGAKKHKEKIRKHRESMSPEKQKKFDELREKIRNNRKGVQNISCSPGVKCPRNSTCWPRGNAGGKCYADPATIGEPCIHTGRNKIKCLVGRCSSKNKGHPSGTLGVCE